MCVCVCTLQFTLFWSAYFLTHTKRNTQSYEHSLFTLKCASPGLILVVAHCTPLLGAGLLYWCRVELKPIK